jgi:hypothetical protein
MTFATLSARSRYPRRDRQTPQRRYRPEDIGGHAESVVGRKDRHVAPPLHCERGLLFVGIDVIDGNLTET